MGIELAKAYVSVRGDTSHFAADIKRSAASIEGSLGGLSGALAGLTGAFTAFAGFSAVLGAINKAGQFEQTTIAFDTMLGSASLTKKTLEDLTEFAAKTPFEMPEILQAARGLIQFGETGEDLMKTLNMLGNAASATSTPFGMVALIFNQIRGVGKLLTQDFRQLSTRGILSLQDIAEHFKTTTSGAQEMLSKGKISFADVQKIFAGLSAEGGRFNNLMEKQSKSLLGLWSTLKDAIGITARTFGETLMPVAKEFVTIAISIAEAIRSWVQENPKLAGAIGKTVVVVGTFVSALLGVIAAMKIVNALTITFLALQGPAGWAKLAVAGVVAAGAMYMVSRATGKAEAELRKTQEAEAKRKPKSKAVQAAEDIDAKSKKEIEDLTKSVKDLVNQLSDGEVKLRKFKDQIRLEDLRKEAATAYEAMKTAEREYYDAHEAYLAKPDPSQLGKFKDLQSAMDRAKEDLAKAQGKYDKAQEAAASFKKVAGEEQMAKGGKTIEDMAKELNKINDPLLESQYAVDDFRKSLNLLPTDQVNALVESFTALQEAIRGAKMEKEVFEPLERELKLIKQEANEVERKTAEWAAADKRRTKDDVDRFKRKQYEIEEAKSANQVIQMQRETEYTRRGLNSSQIAVEEFRRKGIGDFKAFEKATYEREGAELKRSLLTPMEQYEETLRNINRLEKGKFIDPNTARRARRQAFEGAWGGGMGTTIGYMDWGKKIQEFMVKNAGDDIPMKQLKAAEHGNDLQEQMVQIMQNPPPPKMGA